MLSSLFFSSQPRPSTETEVESTTTHPRAEFTTACTTLIVTLKKLPLEEALQSLDHLFAQMKLELAPVFPSLTDLFAELSSITKIYADVRSSAENPTFESDLSLEPQLLSVLPDPPTGISASFSPFSPLRWLESPPKLSLLADGFRSKSPQPPENTDAPKRQKSPPKTTEPPKKDFPEIVLAHIAEWLDKPSQLNGRLTCSKLKGYLDARNYFIEEEFRITLLRGDTRNTALLPPFFGKVRMLVIKGNLFPGIFKLDRLQSTFYDMLDKTLASAQMPNYPTPTSRLMEKLLTILSRSSSLTSLTIQQFDFGKDQNILFAGKVAQLVASTFPNLVKLRVGGGNGRGFGVECVQILLQTPYLSELRDLQVESEPLNQEGAVYITQAIPLYPKLTHLRLWNCDIRGEGVETLIKCPDFVHLVSLNLGWNGLGNDGVQRFTEQCWFLSQLTELDLSTNGIDDWGAQTLANCTSFSSLRILKLELNRIHRGGAFALITSSHYPSLTKLDLSWNFIWFQPEEAQECLKFPRGELHIGHQRK